MHCARPLLRVLASGHKIGKPPALNITEPVAVDEDSEAHRAGPLRRNVRTRHCGHSLKVIVLLFKNIDIAGVELTEAGEGMASESATPYRPSPVAAVLQS